MPVKQKLVFAVVILVIALTFVGVFAFSFRTAYQKISSKSKKIPTQGSLVSEPITEADIPKINTTPAKDNIAVPRSEAPANAEETLKIRTYEINVKDESFNPSTIYVQPGGILRIRFNAVDRDYTVRVPLLSLIQSIHQGETRVMEFQVPDKNRYTIECDDCKGTKGEIVSVR